MHRLQRPSLTGHAAGNEVPPAAVGRRSPSPSTRSRRVASSSRSNETLPSRRASPSFHLRRYGLGRPAGLHRLGGGRRRRRAGRGGDPLPQHGRGGLCGARGAGRGRGDDRRGRRAGDPCRGGRGDGRGRRDARDQGQAQHAAGRHGHGDADAEQFGALAQPGDAHLRHRRLGNAPDGGSDRGARRRRVRGPRVHDRAGGFERRLQRDHGGLRAHRRRGRHGGDRGRPGNAGCAGGRRQRPGRHRGEAHERARRHGARRGGAGGRER